MPELPICQQCSKPIHKDYQDYVIPDKASNPDEPTRWTYYHAECFEKKRN